MNLLELFVEVDDFVQKFEGWAARQQLLSATTRFSEGSEGLS